MVGGNGRNQFREYVRQNIRNQNRNQNGLIVVLGIANQNLNGNGNVVAARAEGNADGNNEKAGIQLQVEEYDLMAAATDLDEIEEVDAHYRSAEVHHYDNCYNNDIFNMFTQEEQYTELLEPIPDHTKYNRMIVMLFLRFLVWNKVGKQ
nr:hypothetical protein [Tanacetum cinerariifolium]